ncbi:MAG TPA: L,D-transpeptidase [Chthoniobacterales bacterium]|nr:L,D-transpeptidase [Chthoniobacterales bacterium]
MRWFAKLGLACLGLVIIPPAPGVAATEIDGISFPDNAQMLFIPVDEIAPPLGWEVQVNQESKQITLNGKPLDASQLRKLTSGTLLVPLNELQGAGATVTWSDDGMTAVVASGFFKRVAIRFVPKRVEVDLVGQRLRAYQGARLVLDSHISSGREGRKTPPGDFKAGPVKTPMHRSRLYHNAPMPWSVQVHENIFIHGFQKVPRDPASHGCIRLPLTGANPAKWFYDWIDIGTPICIRGHWPLTGAGAEKPSRFSRLSIEKVLIAIAAIIVCVLAALFVLQRLRRV